MDIFEDLIVPYNEQIIGFFSKWLDIRAYLDWWTRIDTGQHIWEIQIRYLLVKANKSYNDLLDRPCLNTFEATVSTPPFGNEISLEQG